ncbi:MAG: hypothetical protein MZV70_05730 [Desulfobacterales bacterium]|nr:hypothetical protein [Desulfobacterales bacterium]
MPEKLSTEDFKKKVFDYESEEGMGIRRGPSRHHRLLRRTGAAPARWWPRFSRRWPRNTPGRSTCTRWTPRRSRSWLGSSASRAYRPCCFVPKEGHPATPWEPAPGPDRAGGHGHPQGGGLTGSLERSAGRPGTDGPGAHSPQGTRSISRDRTASAMRGSRPILS